MTENKIIKQAKLICWACGAKFGKMVAWPTFIKGQCDICLQKDQDITDKKNFDL